LQHPLFLWLIRILLIILEIWLIQGYVDLLLLINVNTWSNIYNWSRLRLSWSKLINSWIKLSCPCFIQFYLIHSLLLHLYIILLLLDIVIITGWNHSWGSGWTQYSLCWGIHSALRLRWSLLISHFKVIRVLLLRNYLLPDIAAVHTWLYIIVILQNIRISKTVCFYFVYSLWKWVYLVLWVLRKIR
jgi:hypothetical protein